MTTRTKRTAMSRSMEACFRAMKPGEVVRFSRGDAVIRFTRLEDVIQHTYEPIGSAMHFTVSFARAADWFTEDDGKGAWAMLPKA